MSINKAITRSTWTDDDGTGTTGSIVNNAELQKIYDNIDALVPAAGAILQVVNATYSTEQTSASSTYADTNLTASITPSATSSKVLVIVQQSSCGKVTGNTYLGLRLLRAASVICVFEVQAGFTGNTDEQTVGTCGTTYLDAPSTTSSTAYKTQFASLANIATAYVQRGGGTSTITLMEVAG